MSSQVTVSGSILGGIGLTSKVIPNVTAVLFDTVNKILKVTPVNGIAYDVDISGATTITATVSAGNFTFVVS